MEMENKKKEVISDQEIQTVLNTFFQKFEFSMKQIDDQRKKIITFLLKQGFFESADSLASQLDELKQELSFKIRDFFPHQEVADVNAVFHSDEYGKPNVDFASFSQNVDLAYQNYITRANELMIDTVNVMFMYFPEEFNRNEYLMARNKKVKRKK